MGHDVTIGGERLGSGKKMKAHLRNYERSTHDLSYVWRSTMAAGTLIPFMTEVALPGDTFDINLDADVLTHPTIGPLFGSYKLQLDVFQVPIRLYNGALHMNMLGIGRDMSKIKLPQVRILGRPYDTTQPVDNQHINPSSIWAYLGIRGLGQNTVDPTTTQTGRLFNAIPYLAYWDIYKNYYANKQEEVGYMIHRAAAGDTITIDTAVMTGTGGSAFPPPNNVFIDPTEPYDANDFKVAVIPTTVITLGITGLTNQFDPGAIYLVYKFNDDTGSLWQIKSVEELFSTIDVQEDIGVVTLSNPILDDDQAFNYGGAYTPIGGIYWDGEAINSENITPVMYQFPLENIDNMRMELLTTSVDTQYIIQASDDAPYGTPLNQTNETDPLDRRYSATFNQEGLGLKTYQSDLFNNWIDTEWIDGADGISEITAIDTSGGSFTIDELNLSKKVYDMLNRIAISGGSYDDWLDAVYTHERTKSVENPMYMGGLMKNVIFQEVISNAASEEQPLGTLAGRGRIGGGSKGGKVIIKVDEPSYIMGIVSLTPRIDYSQGNKWDVNLKSMNDLHKPALDEIGFQDLVVDQFAPWTTRIVAGTGTGTYKSAGKQPAWINYMTNVDVVRGNFAEVNEQMFMVLNRRYEVIKDVNGFLDVKDLTTYIDPIKCNYIFADTRRDAQNFWTQIGVNITARRKMSAKIIPNL